MTSTKAQCSLLSKWRPVHLKTYETAISKCIIRNYETQSADKNRYLISMTCPIQFSFFFKKGDRTTIELN